MRFIHTADLHLGMKYSSEYPENVRQKLKEDEKTLLLKILSLAEENNISRILICGDLFDTHKPDKEIRDFVISEFGKFNGKIYIIPGNHDFDGPDSVYTVCGFSENVHIFGSEIDMIEEEELCIYGFGFNAPHMSENIFSGFKAENNHKPSVMMMHTDFNPESFYNPVSLSSIEESGLSYVAAGHIHKPAEISKRGATYFGQSGAPRGLSFKENDAPGVYIINLDNGFLSAVREKVYCNRYRNGEIDVSSAESLEDIKKLCFDFITSEEPSISLVSLVLKGKLRQNIDVDETELYNYLAPLCLFLRIKSDYTVAIDIELLKEENSARGEFVRRALSSFPDKDDDFILKVIEKGVALL